MKLSAIVLVFVGGGLGSMLRYIISIATRPITVSFPYATLIANLIGCFVLGALIGFMGAKTATFSNTYLLFAVGFCGGLTTFSSLTLENMRFIEQGQLFNLVLYTIFSFAFSLIFLYLGMLLHRIF